MLEGGAAVGSREEAAAGSSRGQTQVKAGRERKERRAKKEKKGATGEGKEGKEHGEMKAGRGK